MSGPLDRHPATTCMAPSCTSISVSIAVQRSSLTPLPRRKLIFEELQGRAKEKAAAEAKKAKESRDMLASLMRHSRDISERTSFEDAKDALGRKSEWRAVRGPLNACLERACDVALQHCSGHLGMSR